VGAVGHAALLEGQMISLPGSHAAIICPSGAGTLYGINSKRLQSDVTPYSLVHVDSLIRG
jgi:hypothetical protein